MINNWRTICTRSITNLRAHGVLFYRDSAAGRQADAAGSKPHRHEELKAAELIETSRNAKIERC